MLHALFRTLTTPPRRFPIAALAIVLSASALACSEQDESAERRDATTASIDAEVTGPIDGGAADTAGAPPPDAQSRDAVATATTPRFVPASACPIADILPGRELKCGHVIVPETRGAAATRNVAVAVLVIKSPTPAPDAAPTFYLAGGPGGTSLLEVASRVADPSDEVFKRLLRMHDVVAVDQRGTGSSRPSLDCPELDDVPQDPLPPATSAAVIEANRAALTTCRARVAAGAALDHYRTTDAADDVNDVRRALGYDRIDIFGTSYGTRLGLEVLRRHGSVVRAAVLDSVVPADSAGTLADDGVLMASSFTQLFKRCAASSACAAAFPKLESTFLELLTRLRQTPKTITLKSGKSIAFGAHAAVSTLFSQLYASEGFAAAPHLISAWAHGDFSDLPQLLENEALSHEILSEGLHLSVRCAEDAPGVTVKDANARLADVPEPLRSVLIEEAESSFAACEIWNVAAVDPPSRAPVVSDVDTLLLAGTIDPATPPAQAKKAAATLGKSTVVELVDVGHGALDSDCGASLIEAFLSSPRGSIDAACASATSPLEFVVP